MAKCCEPHSWFPLLPFTCDHWVHFLQISVLASMVDVAPRVIYGISGINGVRAAFVLNIETITS